MTAINVIRQRDAVHVITDAGATRRDGALMFVSSKAWPLPHLSAVFAARGPRLFAPIMVDFVGTIATSYDELKSRIADSVRQYYDGFQPLWALCEWGPEFDLIVAGWSETNGGDSYVLCNHERYTPAVPPWSVVDLGAVSLMPSDEAVLKEFRQIFPAETTSSEDLDPERDGLRILEIQRAENRSLVNGFAQISTITRDAVSTRVLRRWPDLISMAP